MSGGRFVVFEGVDGAGKTTQIGLARAALAARGVVCETTREPGGCDFAEKMRALILSDSPPRDARAEALAMFAARREHSESVIRPALAAGRWVLCDRFSDSTRAYQGAGRGLAREVVDGIEALCDLPRPDFTIVFDVSPQTAARRRGGGDNFYDRADADFRRRARAEFVALARRNPAAAVVDGEQSQDAVAREVLALLTPLCESAVESATAAAGK